MNRKWRDEAYKLLGDAYGYVCHHCGATEQLTIDHILSRHEGGSDEIANLQLLCMDCNRNKGVKADGALNGRKSAQRKLDDFQELVGEIEDMVEVGDLERNSDEYFALYFVAQDVPEMYSDVWMDACHDAIKRTQERRGERVKGDATMNERDDAIGKFVAQTVASFDEGVKHRPPISTADYAERLASYVVRALANTRYPAANAAWKALADEREKRERGTR